MKRRVVLCRALDRPNRWKANTGAEFLEAVLEAFRTKPCEEKAIAETTLGPRCKRHLEEFKEAMADPNTIINVVAGKAKTPKEIAAMIKFIQ